MFDLLFSVLRPHTSHGRPETQTDPIATVNVHPVMMERPKGFNPQQASLVGLLLSHISTGSLDVVSEDMTGLSRWSVAR